jgi:FkbM family methyltransferase
VQRAPHEQLGHVALGVQLEWLLAHYQINLILDVGANDGQFAREMRELGYNGRIASFEPMASCIATLQKLAEADPLWSVHPFGLGREAGSHQLTR